METQAQIEKLQEEYNRLIKEFKSLRQKHSIINKEYNEISNKLDDLSNQSDALSNEMIKNTDNIREEERKYIEKQEAKIVLITIIIAIVGALSFGRIPFFLEAGIVDILANAFMSTALYSVVGSTTVTAFLLNSKVNNIFRNKFQKTDVYSKYKELFDEKDKEIKKLKSESKEVENARYQAFDKVRNINTLLESKQKEIEEVKNKTLSLFFEEPQEETLVFENASFIENSHPLVKTRKKD